MKTSLFSYSPLTGFSFPRVKSVSWLAAVMGLSLSAASAIDWDGGGDGVTWTDPLNWDGDVLPTVADLAAFNFSPQLIQPNGNQSVLGLSFFDNYVLGGFGNSSLLTLAGSTSVTNLTPNSASITINSLLTTGGATPGLYIGGSGGTVNLTNIYNQIGGNITLDGTTLLMQSSSLAPHLSGTGINLQNRSDALVLGGPNNPQNRNIILKNGGQFAVYGAGYNPDGSSKVFNLDASGGGAINVVAGYQQFSLDDAAQITGTGNLTKTGNGRLTLTSQAFGLTGNLQVSGGVLDVGTSTAPAVTNDYNRMSVFAQTATITVGVPGAVTGTSPRPMFVMNNGTATQIDSNIVLNPNGTIGANGADSILGAALALHSPSSSTLTLNGGTLLNRNAFDPQTTRFLRVDALVQGSGTVDIVGSTLAASNPRTVFQRGDLAHTFSGTYRLQGNNTLEANPRFSGVLTVSAVGVPATYNSTSNSGNSFGSNATIELAGFNSGLDLRDNGGVASFSGSLISAYNRNIVLPGYSGNKIVVSSTEPGGIQRIVGNANLIPSATATATAGHIASFPAGSASDGNIYAMSKLQFTGSQWLQVNAGANYSYRFDDLTFAASASNPWLDNAAGNIRITNAVAGASTDLVKRGNAELSFLNNVTLNTLDIRHGAIRLQGAAGAFTGVAIIVNGGNNSNASNFGGGSLILDNTTGSNPDRINSSTIVELKGTSTLRLDSLSGTNTTETIDNLNVNSGNPTINAVRTGGTETSALTIGLSRGANPSSVINFAGTSLGTAASGVGQIFITSQAATSPAAGTNAGMLGAWAYTGNDWAKYDANGVRAFAATDYDTTTTLATGINANPSAAVTLAAATTTQSLKLSQTASTVGLVTNGNLLRIESGGILSTTNSAQGISGTNVVGSGITAGLAANTAEKLYINTTADLRLSALVQDNGSGPVTLVKSGGNTLFLVPQSLTGGLFQAASTGGITAAPGSYPSQPFTGGMFINGGTVNVWRNELLGNGPITLAGGAIELNHGVTGTNNNTNLVLPGGGNDVIVTANSTFGWDNNAEAADASAGNNNLNVLGKLTIKAGQELAFGGFNGNDTRFNNGAEFEPGAVLVTLQRDGNSNLILKGAVTGTAPLIAAGNVGGGNPQGVAITNGGAASVVLGAGATDNVPNTYTGTFKVNSGTLRLDKANGTTAVTGDILINGGTIAFGGTIVGNRNAFSGWGQAEYDPVAGAFGTPSGLNQIADTASVTMLSGTFGENNRINLDTIKNYTQQGGTWNPGVQRLIAADGLSSADGKFVVTGTATLSGGSVAFNSGTHLDINKLVLLDGAQNLNIANNSTDLSNPTILEIGSGGLELNGNSVILSQGGTVNGTGARLLLGGNVTINTAALNAGSYTHVLAVQTGASFRELNDNSYVDFTEGARTFNISEQAYITASAILKNGSLVKTGLGTLALEPFKNNALSALTVNGGVVAARGYNSIGSGANVTVGNGGTLKLESTSSNNNNLTLTGDGAMIAGTQAVDTIGVKWDGALVSEYGQNTLNGAVAISGGAKISSYATQFASTAGLGVSKSFLQINSAGGITGTGALTWSGDGDGVIANGINTDSTFTKLGGGTLTVAGAGSYTGKTEVQGGALRITHGSALGTTAGSTTVYGGGQLQLGGVSVAGEALQLGGNGLYNVGGALRATDGANTWSGNVTLSAAATVSVDAGATLDLTSATALQPAAGIANPSLTVAGSGTGSISSGINLGTGGLTQVGNGTWSLTGNSTYSGVTTLAGGTTNVNAAATTPLGSGTLSLQGGKLAATGAGTITKAATGFGSGGGEVSAASGSTVDLGAITIGTGGSAVFSGPGTLNGSGSLINTILPSSAIGTDLVTFSGTTMQALAPGLYSTSMGEALLGGNLNASVPTSLNVTGAGNNLSINALRIGDGGGVVASGGISLTAGTLLSSSSMNAGINGGNITSPGDLTVITNGALDIAAKIQPGGTSRLIKDGSGTLTLSGDNSTTLTGDIYVNGGTLAFLGGVGTAHPNALGSATARSIVLNGGALSMPSGEWDPGAGQLQIRIGTGGGTLDVARNIMILNDAAQLAGNGDLIKTGGGRLQIGQGPIGYTGFTGNVTVNGGVLSIINQDAVGNIPGGNRITVNAGAAFINSNGTTGAVGSISLNPVSLNNAQYFVGGGDRILSGDLILTGTNAIPARDADTASQNRSPMFNGRITQEATGILNISGVRNDSFVQFTGTNDLRGTINLGANAGLSSNGDSLSTAANRATVNMNGPNSRFLLRNLQNGQSNVNLNINTSFSELFAGRINANGGGTNQWQSVNNLSIAGGSYVSITGDNGFDFRVEGTTTIGKDVIINTPNGSANLWTTGPVAFASGAGIDRRNNVTGASTWIISNTADTAAATTIHGGLIILRDDVNTAGVATSGTLPNTTKVDLRGGELRIENTNGANADRINNGAQLVLGGGTLRISGTETTLAASVSAEAGTTSVIYNAASAIAKPEALTLPSFTRSTGATLAFGTDTGTVGAVVANNALGNTATAQAQPRINIPALASTTGTNIFAWGWIGTDWLQNDPAALSAADFGMARGLYTGVTYTGNLNPTSTQNANYGGVAAYVMTTSTANSLRVNNATAATVTIPAAGLALSSGGVLTTGANHIIAIAASPTGTLSSTGSELFLNVLGNQLTISAPIGGTNVVKSGGGTLVLSGTNTFAGGFYVNGGSTQWTSAGANGSSANTIFLQGGELSPNFTSNNAGATMNWGNNVVVNATSSLTGDNGTGTAGVVQNHVFGSLTFNGNYGLNLSGFDGSTLKFTGVNLNGFKPSFQLVGNRAGGTGTNDGQLNTLGGAITGAGGFRVLTIGTENAATARAGTLQIGSGAGDVANTYTGTVQVAAGRVQLNKPDNVIAITADADDTTYDLELLAGNNAGATVANSAIMGAYVRLNANEQIADAANVRVSGGRLDFNSKSETIKSLLMDGGHVVIGGAGTSTVNITGNVDLQGTGLFTGADGASNITANGLDIGVGATVTIGGNLTVGQFGRMLVSPTNPGATTVTVKGNIDLTGGNSILAGGAYQNGGGTIKLNSGSIATVLVMEGNLSTQPSAFSAMIDGTNDTDNYVDLKGDRTFNIANGTAGDDFIMSAIFRNNGANIGGLIKTGAGTMTINNTTNVANSYGGATTVNGGELILSRAAASVVVPGVLNIGNGTDPAAVRLRNSNQIADTSAVTINAGGVLDLEFGNASETVASVAGAGRVLLGSGSLLTTGSASDTTFSGSITGNGGITKTGAGKWELTGSSNYAGTTTITGGNLAINGSVAGTPVVINTGGILSGTGNVSLDRAGPVLADAAVLLNTGGSLNPGNSPGILNTGSLATTGGTVNFEIGGFSAGNGTGFYDQLNVTGAVNLTGTTIANFSLFGGWTTNPTDVYYLLKNDGVDAINGTFDLLPEGAPLTIGGTPFTATYLANAEGSSTTGGNDFALIAVPEPTAVMLALVTGLGIGLRRRRK